MTRLETYVSDKQQAAPSESWSSKLGREADLAGESISGLSQAAADAWAHPGKTGLKVAGAIGTGVGLGLLCRGGGFGGLVARGAGLAMTASFAGEAIQHGSDIASAATDAWSSGANMDANRAVMRKHGGEFLFDTALYSVAGIGSAKLSAKFAPKVSEHFGEMRDARQLRNNFDHMQVAVGDGTEVTMRFPKREALLRTSVSSLDKALAGNRQALEALTTGAEGRMDRLALHGTTEVNAKTLLESKTSKNDLFSAAGAPATKDLAASLEAQSAIAFHYGWTTPRTYGFVNQKSGPAVMILERTPHDVLDLHPEKFGKGAASRYYYNEPSLWTGTGREGQVEISLTPENFGRTVRGAIYRNELDRFDPSKFIDAFSPEKLTPKQYNRRYEAGEPFKIDRLGAFGAQYVGMRALQIFGH